MTVGTALPPASSRYADEAQEIARLVNEERAVNGLKALTYRPVLEGLAQARARESSEYWSHTRPDGRMFNSIFSDYGLHYQGEGENLFASNVLDTGLAMEEWMNSPTIAPISCAAILTALRSASSGAATGIITSASFLSPTKSLCRTTRHAGKPENPAQNKGDLIYEAAFRLFCHRFLLDSFSLFGKPRRLQRYA